MDRERPLTYQFWLAAFRKIVKEKPRGLQKELARKIGVSAVHINDILGGRKGASLVLQEKVAQALGYAYEEMIKIGKEALGPDHRDELFPDYYDVISAPRDKRFDMIVKIAQREAGCPLVVFDDELRKQYEEWRVTEEEVYREVLKQMKAVKRAMERVDGEM